MSSSVRYVQWSTDAAPSSTASRTPAPKPSWLPCTRRPRPAVAAGLQHRARLVGVERALLAEHVDPARVRRAGVEHLAADQVDVVVGAALVLGGHHVRAEEGHVVGELAGDVAQPPLGLDVEPVARLDLDVRDPGAEGLGAAGARQLAELVRRWPRGSPRW